MELTALAGHVMQRAQSQSTGPVEQGGPAESGRFARMMEERDVRSAASEEGASRNARFVGSRQVADKSAGSQGVVLSLADRILSNVSSNSVRGRVWRQPQPVEEFVPKYSIDNETMAVLLQRHLQIVKDRTELGLAVAGVQKSTQGLDTLLKAQ